LGIAYLFISHDLGVVRHISDQAAVMYLGRIVEMGDCFSLYEDPRHPYTQSLLSSVPIPDPRIQRNRKRILLRGDPPSPLNPPEGCSFHTRCPQAEEKCAHIIPNVREIKPGHLCTCHLI